MGRPHNAQRTATPTHREGAAPWGQDGSEAPARSKAAAEDRRTRAAYPGQVVRSAYLATVRLPEAVRPGDTGAALDILDRIEAALALKGRWTPTERGRLRNMREAWQRRAAGADISFNIAGWRRQWTYVKGRGAWERRKADRIFAAQLEDLRSITDGKQHHD